MIDAHSLANSAGSHFRAGRLPAPTIPAPAPSPSERSQYGLDTLNFFVADVQTGFGPFIAVYLTVHGWNHGMVGSVLTAGTIAGVLSQTPSGILVDWTRAKRTVVAAGLLMIAAGSVLLALLPRYGPVLVAELLHGIPGSVIRNAIAGIGLGLVGHRAYNIRIGRNHRYDSFGNALTAMAMGALGTLISFRAPFFAAAGLCAPALLALMLIRPGEIDYRRARAAASRRSPKAARWRHLLRERRLRVLSICMFLFQFANASILVLGTERLATDERMHTEIITSAMVAVPQLVSAIIALRISRAANDWGRKPFILAGFVAVLTRAVLFAVAPGPWFLIAVQSLDGITAAVIGIMVPLVIADITRGTARYNAALGAVGTVSMIGAALSTTAIGFVADRFGLAVGFAALAAAALAGFLLLWRLPETVRYAMMEN